MGLSSTHIQNGPGTTWILVSASSYEKQLSNPHGRAWHHPSNPEHTLI